MRKFWIFLFFVLLVTVLNWIDIPKVNVNSDNLPEGEMKKFIMRSFPSIGEKQVLVNEIKTNLKGDYNPENIRNVLIKMGMVCSKELPICQYNGYVTVVAEGISSGEGRAKHIYAISLWINQGIDSIQIEKEIQ